MSVGPEESEIQTMASAFQEVAATMKSVHAVFIRLAIWIPIILVLFMMILTIIIVQVGWNTEKRMTERLNSLPTDVAKALHVEQNQNTNVKIERSEDMLESMSRDILKKDGKL